MKPAPINCHPARRAFSEGVWVGGGAARRAGTEGGASRGQPRRENGRPSRQSPSAAVICAHLAARIPLLLSISRIHALTE